MVSVYILQFPPNAPIEWSGLRRFTNIGKNPLNWPSLDIKIILVVLNTCQMRVITVFGGHLLFVLFMIGTIVYEKNTVIIPCSCFSLSPDLARAPKTHTSLPQGTPARPGSAMKEAFMKEAERSHKNCMVQWGDYLLRRKWRFHSAGNQKLRILTHFSANELTLASASMPLASVSLLVK